MRLFRLIAHGMAATLDLCMGALIVAVVSSVLGVHAPLWWYPIGSFLAVLPDLDIVLPSITGAKLHGNHHETVMHRPIIVVPVATILGFLVGGSVWGIIAVICTLWHFIHDMRELDGGGIAWLWPFSRRYQSFLGSQWPEESRMGKEPHYYLKWLRPTTLAIREMTLAAVAVGVAGGIALGSARFGVGLSGLVVGMAVTTWVLWEFVAPKSE